MLLAVATFVTGLMFVAVLRLFVSFFEAPAVTTLRYDAQQPNARASPLIPDEPGIPELSCYDPAILPIWGELKQDGGFNDQMAPMKSVVNCSDIVEVERIELNGTAPEEFLVRGKDLSLCGATGNCLYWVFEIHKGEAKKLLSSGGLSIDIEKSNHYGSRDLLVRFNGSSYPDSLIYYRFDGFEYRAVRCYEQDKQTLEKWRESCEGR